MIAEALGQRGACAQAATAVATQLVQALVLVVVVRGTYMRPFATSDEVIRPGLTAALRHSLWLVRWFTILALFFDALAQPLIGRAGLPTWSLVLVFAVYNGLVAVLCSRVRWLRSCQVIALLDFALMSALYSMAASPSGVMFILLLLITVWAAATVSLRQSLLHTIATMLLVAAISPTLPLWIPDAAGMRELFARLIILALASTTTALLVLRLEQEHAAAQSSRADAERQAELNRLTGVFISSVSHDLRTPLTALRSGLGMLQMSIGDRLDADEEQLLWAARRNSERLSLLIDDLLTYNQLEARALQLTPASIDLAAIATGAVSTLRPLLSQKQQHLLVELPRPLPSWGDARRLEQVVINLVANAHDHTPSGTRIRLSGRVMADEVLVTVADDGPGMAAEELGRIFERFQRLTTAKGGSGLGLAIAKSMVELHGGRIWAESECGSGTLLHVALPLRDPDRPGHVLGKVPDYVHESAHSGRRA